MIQFRKNKKNILLSNDSYEYFKVYGNSVQIEFLVRALAKNYVYISYESSKFV